MDKKTGAAAFVAAVSLTALAGCTSATTGTTTAGGGSTSTGSTNTGSGGSGGGSGTPASMILAAVAKSTSDNSVTITGSVTGGTTGTTTKMSGVEEFQPLKSSLTISMSGGAAAGQDMSAIFDGTNYYIKSPQLSALAGGKTWIELNTSALTGGTANPLSSLSGSLKTQSPLSELDALVAAGDLKQVGTESVDGQQTTHYTGSLTAAQASDMAATNGLDAQAVAQIKAAFADGGFQTETIDLWTGSNSLPVRIVSAVNSTTLGTVTSTFDFTGWGAPVTITDPPSDQVGTFSIPGLPTSSD
ncbi:MAG TPA: hypothetical protein VGX23_29160 [Actinocrinis sp.]|nr:hypothetical protein [Actinocrinis sp.]